MIKSIIKETFIMILLCAAIVLILGVLFYKHIPTNKILPNKLEAYTTPNNIQEQLDEPITEMNKVEVSYQITGSDLDLYKQTNSYTPGKPDPFAASPSVDANVENNEDTDENEVGDETINGTSNQTSSGSSTSDPNSTGTFFNDTGLK